MKARGEGVDGEEGVEIALHFFVDKELRLVGGKFVKRCPVGHFRTGAQSY